MNTLVRSLLTALLCVSAANAAIKTDRTFIAHRDELSNVGMNWTTGNHHRHKGNHQSLGATFMATPFYASSTNHEDLSKLFGNQDAGGVKVQDLTVTLVDADLAATNYYSTSPSDPYNGLYGHMVDHVPTSYTDDTATDDPTTGTPMYGDVALKPERNVWGVDLSWDQSLDTILRGLRFSVRAPLVEVSTSMKTAVTGTASAPTSTDGKTGATLDEFFNGTLNKNIATYTTVSQKGLLKGKMDSKWHSMVGVGDVDVRLHFSGCNFKRVKFGVAASLRIPTGNAPTGEWAFGPIYGARGHVAAGACLNAHVDGFSKGNLKVGFDMIADWQYFFKGTEKRTLGVYDLTNKAMVTSSQYRNVMRQSNVGVQPAGNVMTVDHSVTPGHQLDALAGFAATWHNWTFDLGYNLFWHEKEKVEVKAGKWSDDRYAFAHPAYNMSTAFVTNHKNVIGTAGEVDNDLLPDDKMTTSWNGPIQQEGKTTSTLMNQVEDSDVTSDDTGTLAVQYNISTANAVTEAQMTHSVVGGVGYKFQGNYPVILGLGGQYEFQENNRNSALEGYKVWAKLGVCF